MQAIHIAAYVGIGALSLSLSSRYRALFLFLWRAIDLDITADALASFKPSVLKGDTFQYKLAEKAITVTFRTEDRSSERSPRLNVEERLCQIRGLRDWSCMN